MQQGRRYSAEFLIFGKNVRSYRKYLGWTAQECADKCGIGRATLKRIESGAPCYKSTQDKIRWAFGIKPEALWEPDLAVTRNWFHFDAQTSRWSFADPEQAERWALNEEPRRTDPEAIQSSGERQRLGSIGLSAAFQQLHRCHLPDGFHSHMKLEVYHTVNFKFPVQVTSFCIYCIRGTLELHIEDEMRELHQGDIFTFNANLTVRLVSRQAPNTAEPALVFATVLQLASQAGARLSIQSP